MVNLAGRYSTGTGLLQNESRAAELMRAAAERGDVNAQYDMYIEDVLGSQEGDLIRKIPGVAALTPSRRVRRASWTLTGTGVCCE